MMAARAHAGTDAADVLILGGGHRWPRPATALSDESAANATTAGEAKVSARSGTTGTARPHPARRSDTARDETADMAPPQVARTSISWNGSGTGLVHPLQVNIW